MTGRDASNPLATSPGDGLFNVKARQVQLEATVLPSGAVSPHDSIARTIAAYAAAWVSRFQGGKPTGMQLDNMAQLALVAGQEALSRTYIAGRLSAPGLPLVDRVYTLTTAAVLFADANHPERLEQAKTYLSQLEKIPPSTEAPVAELSYRVRWHFANVYHQLGMTDSVIVYGEDALRRLGALPFVKRRFTNTPFPIVAEAWAGRADGRAAIERWGTYLRKIAQATSQEIAADTNAAFYSRSFVREVMREVNAAALLGNVIPGVIAHYWLNSPRAGGTVQSLADGTVRLIMLGDFQCPHCIESMPMLKRLNIRYTGTPSAEIVYVTRTYGLWGIDPVPPDVEVKHLKEYYVNTRGFTFPIAIWAPRREQTSDGNFAVPESPNAEAFVLRGTPSFYLTDATGRLRHIVRGYSANTERDLVSAFDALIAERDHRRDQ